MQEAITKICKDPVMAAIVARVGEFSMVYRPADFESLVRSIVSQQISTKVARVFMQRLVARMRGGVITPEAILKNARHNDAQNGLYRRENHLHSRPGAPDRHR